MKIGVIAVMNKQLLTLDAQKVQDAFAVIQALVQGLHPATKEPLPDESVLQDVRVIRALLTCESSLNVVRGRVERRAALPTNTGRAWSNDEDARLESAFRDGASLEDIAANHRRSMVAVEYRLEKLGLIKAEERRTNNTFVATTMAGRHKSAEAGTDEPRNAESGEKNYDS